MSEAAQSRVAWIAIEPTPYKLPFLELVGRRGEVDLHVFFCRWDSPTRPWRLERQSDLKATLLRGWTLPGRGHYRVNPGIVGLLLGRRWDVVVLSGYSHPTMLLALFCCLLLRIPFVIQGESHVLKRRSGRVRRWKRRLLFPLLRRSRAALATGTLSRRYWVEEVGIAPDRVFIVANTPDVEFFRREADIARPRRMDIRGELGVHETAPLGVFVGRLIRVKGVDLLLEGLARLPAEKRPWLAIVGEGAERAGLEELAARHGLPVKFLGWRQTAELPALYAAADFFVLPSRHEPWGVVVNEAMASGLPVVLSEQVGAAHDLLVEGRTGWMVRGETAEAWAAALARCVDDRGQLAAMGEEARELIGGWTHERSADEFQRAVDVAVPRTRRRREPVDASARCAEMADATPSIPSHSVPLGVRE